MSVPMMMMAKADTSLSSSKALWEDRFLRLNSEQREAASFDEGQLLILAPAGTGKTEVMTSRIVRLIASERALPSEVLALTFTTKAGRELASRIGAALGAEALPAHVGTFHRLALDLLRQHPHIAGLKPGFEIAGEGTVLEIVQAAMKKAGFTTRRKNRFAVDPVKQVADKISRMKDDGFAPAEAAVWLNKHIAAEPASAGVAQQAAAIAESVLATMRRRNLVDFADMVLWPMLALERDAEFRLAWAGQFKFVVVDEYQDVNDAQYRFARASASIHGNIAVVGDDDQNLYAFRGSSPEYILRFSADWPAAKVVNLVRNYRSVQPILDAASRLIAHNDHRFEKQIIAAGGLISSGAAVTAAECQNCDHEAQMVARTILTRTPDIALERCAVLYRSAFQGRAIEDALRAQGVGFGVVAGSSFYKRREILDALALLTLAEMPESAEAGDCFRRMVNVPARGIGPALLAEIAGAGGPGPMSAAASWAADRSNSVAEGLRDWMTAIDAAAEAEQPLGHKLRDLLEGTGYSDMLQADAKNGRERRENLDELCSLADRFADAFSFLSHCTAAAEESEAAGQYGQVQLSTIHGVKGLEFDMVCMIGCAEGHFPSARSLGEDRLEEERRLAYVAITRAKYRCHMTWPRFAEKRRTASTPSRFIDEAGITATFLDAADIAAPKKGRKRRRRPAAKAPSRKSWEPKDKYWLKK